MVHRLKTEAESPRYDDLAATAPVPVEVGSSGEASGSGGHALLSGRRIARGVVWSLLGQVLPGIVALVATPFIVRGFGDSRFGLLTIAWMVVGYFSLFDFGLGRAVTHAVADALAASDEQRVGDVFWTSTYLLAALGIAGMLVLALAAPWIVEHGIRIPVELRGEARATLMILAICVPFVVLSTGFRGVLEGAQAFGWTNAVRIPLGVLGLLVPVVTLHFSRSLLPTIWALLAVRVIGAGAFLVLSFRLLAPVRRARSFSRVSASALLRFGAWITVSNVISPIMVSMDRFVVGGMLSLAMVTYYATPFEAVSRLLIVSAAIGAVIFPAMAAARALGSERLLRIYAVATRTIFLAVFPLALLIVTLAPELLGLWLGGAFPERSTTVLRWLTLGIVVNAIASVPYALIQSVGRSDITAKAHLVELPIFLTLLFVLIRAFGIEGAAAAWVIRVTLDCAILVEMGRRVAAVSRSAWLRDYATMLAFLLMAWVSTIPASVGARLAWGAVPAVLFVAVGFGWMRSIVPSGLIGRVLARRAVA